MLDKKLEIKTDTGTEFEIIPEDTYQAVIDGIELVEQPKYRKPSEMEEVIAFRFALLSEDPEINGRLVWKRIKPVVNAGFKNGKASSLYSLLKTVFKKEPDMEKIYTETDINSMLDKQLRLLVEVKKTQKDGREYNKVGNFLVSKTDMEVSDEILEQRKKLDAKKNENDEDINPITGAKKTEEVASDESITDEEMHFD